jgi:hypothetical protein
MTSILFRFIRIAAHEAYNMTIGFVDMYIQASINY